MKSTEIIKEVGYIIVLLTCIKNVVRNNRHRLTVRKLQAIFSRLMDVETFIHGLLK